MDEKYFEEDATMRLLARERAAMGIEPPAPRWRSSPLSEMSYGYHEDEPPERSGATVVTNLTAQPAEGLIPGAVVTVACAIVNDGVEPARNVRVVIPLPEGARYVPGSVRRDGTYEADAEAEALLGEGRDLGTLAAGRRTSLIVLLAVDPGLAPLVVSVNVTAENAAVVGARSLHLTRALAHQSPFAQQVQAAVAPPVAAPAPPSAPVEQPFYELDAEEELVYEAADAALSDAAAPAPPPGPRPQPLLVAPSEAPTPPPPPVARPVPPQAPLAPPPPPPPRIAVPTVVPAPVPPAPRRAERGTSIDVQGGALFTVPLPRARIAVLAQLFAGAKPIGMLAHYLLLNAIAAVEPLPRTDDDSLARFAGAQEQRLSRALIARRLGKPLVAEDIAAPLPAEFPPKMILAESVDIPAPADPGTLVLYRVMRPNELSFLNASVNNVNAAPFMRASQLFVGVCAQNATAGDETQRAGIASALRAYSAAAASEINRLFVRGRLTKKIDLFALAPAELDREAALLLALLERTA